MHNIDTEKVSLKIADGTQMNAYVARPSDSLKHPGLLVLQEAFGVNAHIRDVTERFAREGYVSIAPELYHRTAPGFEGKYDDIQSAMPHMKAITEKGMIEDLRAAYDWLTGNSHVAPDMIASIGFCMGGRLSWRARRSRSRRQFLSTEEISRRRSCLEPLICMRQFCFSGAGLINILALNSLALSWTNASAPGKRA